MIAIWKKDLSSLKSGHFLINTSKRATEKKSKEKALFQILPKQIPLQSFAFASSKLFPPARVFPEVASTGFGQPEGELLEEDQALVFTSSLWSLHHFPALNGLPWDLGGPGCR